MHGSVTYSVVVDGSLLPGHDATQAAAALVRRFGLTEDAADDLLRGGREVVKQGLDQAKSETYVTALRQCGVLARAERAERASTWSGGGGEAPLSVDYAAAYVPAAQPVRGPPPRSQPAERVEPTTRGASLTMVGWSFIVAIPVALLTFSIGDASGRGAMFLVLCAIGVMVICNFWLLSLIWQEGGALWAIAAFLFWPAGLLFIVQRWDVARPPFLISLAASLVYFAGFPSLANLGAVECGASGSFSYDDGDGCVCEDGYDWCGAEDNDMSCCRP